MYARCMEWVDKHFGLCVGWVRRKTEQVERIYHWLMNGGWIQILKFINQSVSQSSLSACSGILDV